jgi:serine/threonine protein kinase
VNPAAEAATPKTCPSCGTRYTAEALFCPLDGAPLTTSPGAIAAAAATDSYVGREILGHIEIRQLVGIGAMGRVYRAFQRGIDRDVAVKILHRELSANEMLVARFHREAKVASRLAHPHVVHVLLVGQLPDGAMYIVMEFLDGLSLKSALAAAGGAMPLPRALHLVLQLCDAAGEAHAQDIVHRDLKPENVMLIKRADDPDFVKVLDFGIARLNWGEQSMATAAGLIFGTARYISPEGAQGEKVGPQGDVYSIATIVYQMLSGRTPFDGDQAVALLVQQIHDAPPPLKGIPRAAYVPEPIADVVMDNLAKRVEQRADNARAFGRALLDAAVASGLSAQDILARPSMMGGGRGQQASVVQMASLQRTKQLQLDPGIAARLDAAPSHTTQTAYETLASSDSGARAFARTEIAEPASLPPGAETTRWSPPADFEARLVSQSASGADTTMDDQQLSAGGGLPSSAPHSTSAPGVSSQLRTPAPGSSRPSFADSTPATSESTDRVRRSPARAVVLVLLCFLVGAVGMGAVAYRAGMLGNAGPSAQQRDGVSDRANDSLPHDRREAPAATASVALAPNETAVPPLARSPSSVAPRSATGGTRVLLDASNAKPPPGQTVDFVARIVAGASGVRTVDGPSFRIAGPGVGAGTMLDAADDGSGGFHTTFTFLQPGRFEVTFAARADGAPVRATRPVVVSQPSTLPSPPSPPAGDSANVPGAPAAAPSGSVKWL